MEGIKAQNFFGYFTLRTGTIISGLAEIVVGGCVWLMLTWIRPQMRLIAELYLAFYTIAGCIGVAAGARKSVKTTWVFVGFLTTTMVLSLLMGLEFLDAIHFLPQPPTAPTTKSDEIPFSAAANVSPLNSVVKTDPDKLAEKTAEHAASEAKKARDREEKEEKRKKREAERKKAKKASSKTDKGGDSDSDESAFVDLAPHFIQLSQAKMPAAATVVTDLRQRGWELVPRWRETGRATGRILPEIVSALVANIDEDEDSEAQRARERAKAQAQKGVKGAPAKGVSEEELSVDELPAVYGELSREGQKLVEAQMKSMKQQLRRSFGVTLVVLSLCRCYHWYCCVSWALNKCISFEALARAPDEYVPLMVAPEERIGANDLEL